MRLITAARGDKPFVTLFDFARRVDLKRIGKRPVEMLARAGAFDLLDPNRHRVFDSIDALVAYSSAVHDQKSSNQVSLFGDAGDDLPEPRLSRLDDWLPAQRLAEEFKAVGFYLTGHPLDDYMVSLRRKQVLTLDEVTARAEQSALVAKMAGTVSGRREMKSARGNRFAFVQLSDPTGQYEITVFSDVLEASRDHLEIGAQIVVQVEATMEADQLKLLGRSIAPIDLAVAAAGSAGLRVFVGEPEAVDSVRSVLERAVQDRVKGSKGPIYFCIMAEGLPGEVELDLGQDFPVNPQIKAALRSLNGVIEVEEVI
jgi:DNA polymerase-3 subunit alpha